MKKISILLAGLSILIIPQVAGASSRLDNQKEPTENPASASSIKLSASTEILPLAQSWVKDFTATHPSSKFETIGTMDANAENLGSLSLISTEESPVLKNSANWKMVVAREVVVPIFNTNNPMIGRLQKEGFSAEKLSNLLEGGSNRFWSVLLKGGENLPVHLCMINEAKILQGVGEFAGVKFNPLDYMVFQSSYELFEAVKSDRLAIGFCRLSDLRAYQSTSTTATIALLPIDKNGNGRLDNFENIYANLDEFMHGVYIGKYPKSLITNIYAVAPAKPETEQEMLFLTWLVQGGQQILNSNGFCDLTNTEKQKSLAALSGIATTNEPLVQTAAVPQSWPLALTITAFLGLFLFLFFYSRRRVASTLPDQSIEIAPLLIEKSVNVPKGLYFDKTHTWAFMEKDGNVKVGMADFLQHITGKLTKILMKEEGDKVRKGEKIMTIVRDGKQLNLYAPISGTILKQNRSLSIDSSLINTSPYAEGWVYLIEPLNWLREVQFMFMGDKYGEWLRDEFTRLKDFIAASAKRNNLVYAHVVLQDGGELTDNVLADLEPEIWEDFQTQFIDTSR